MRIVVVGSGGREHALVRRFVREGHTVVGVPGNPGIAQDAGVAPCASNEIPVLTAACHRERPDLVVVGPEAPLAGGLADELRARGIATFGPSAAATRLESSKAFAKAVMRAAHIPTAAFEVVGDEAEIDRVIAMLGGSVAVKADGLWAGKGVVVCETAGEARAAARRLLERGRVVIEERLSGPELSVIALTDGERLALLPPARDHKRLGDGDRGPNTGGMGAVCPVAIDEATLAGIRETVLRPAVGWLAQAEAPFVGALYAGLMLTETGPEVLEFNARFGDPETQAILASIDPSVGLGALCLEASTGRLAEAVLLASRAACCVVVASAGYPEAPRKGDPIDGLDEARAAGAEVLHAGTRIEDGRLVSAGGRVLNVVATGESLEEARARANAAAARIRLPGKQVRTDIGAS